MHLYLFWRLSSVPLVKRYISPAGLVASGIILWVVFFLGRVTGHHGTTVSAFLLEFAGMTWMAVLFLSFVPLLIVDIITLFGFFLPEWSPTLRGISIIFGLILSVIALFQGFRAPVMDKYEVSLQGLPGTLDGTTLIAMSDMHIGPQTGADRLSELVARVNKENPHIIVLLGDIFEGHGAVPGELINLFDQLSAPMGLWAVTGNHERGSVSDLFRKTGSKLLNNQWEEAGEGLILAGVDDLTANYRQGGSPEVVTRALKDRPEGATIFLSHTPWFAEEAANAGAGLMLSGHTHGGQIWPFDFLVKSRYPLLEGSYVVDGMKVIVSRGAGTWGPRMRLWAPGQILHITLRSE